MRNCVKRKIVKIVATRCQILTLKCTKIDFGWGSAQTLLGELTALPRPLAGFKGPTSKGRGGEGEEVRGGGARPVCLLVLTLGYGPGCAFSGLISKNKNLTFKPPYYRKTAILGPIVTGLRKLSAENRFAMGILHVNSP